jgi:hypothetical protein
MSRIDEIERLTNSGAAFLNSKKRGKAILLAPNISGGADRDRTDDLMTASHALSQLSYSPGYQEPLTKTLLSVNIYF